MTNGALVVDASVLVEYLVDLRHSVAATRLFAGLLDVRVERELWAPDLIYAETVSALRKLVRLKEIEASAGSRAVAQLMRLPLAVATTAPLMGDVWKLGDTMTPYDATYVALAQALRVPLVTADAKLARSPAASSVPIIELDAIT